MIPGSFPVGVSDGGYRARAVNFDGTNDWLSKSSALTGIANGSNGTLSVWVRIGAGGGGAVFEMWTSGMGAPRLFCEFNASDKFFVTGRNTGATTVLSLTAATAVTADATWHHFIASWNSTTEDLYLDGTLDNHNGTGAGNVNYAVPLLGVGARPDGSVKLNADLAEVWFDTSYIDLSVAANMQKFRSATGKPVSLGGDGSVPTGSAPLVYLQGPASGFQSNLGSGGSYTVNGTLTDSTTSPSD